jgi:hypothetical protein
MDADHEKEHIERAIQRARDGISTHVDQLDAQLRRTLDVKSAVTAHAPQIIAGGAAVGFLIGFGFPKAFKRLLQIGVPLALVAYKVKQSRDGGAADDTGYGGA